jgi:putative tricarboxylic transport membrane protein
VLLGLVLGPLAENRLFLSTDNYGLAWLWRPGVLLIFAVTLFGIFYPMIKERRKRTKSESTSSAFAATEVIDRARATRGAVFSFIVVAALILALWQSRKFGFRAGLFPWVIGFPVLLLAVIQLVLDFTGRTRFKTEGIGIGPELSKQVVYNRTFSICSWTIGYFVAIWLLGFSLAVPVTTVLYLKIAGKEKWPITLILSFIAWAFFYGLFEYGLHIPFPDPALLGWLK